MEQTYPDPLAPRIFLAAHYSAARNYFKAINHVLHGKVILFSFARAVQRGEKSRKNKRSWQTSLIQHFLNEIYSMEKSNTCCILHEKANNRNNKKENI